MQLVEEANASIRKRSNKIKNLKTLILCIVSSDSLAYCVYDAQCICMLYVCCFCPIFILLLSRAFSNCDQQGTNQERCDKVQELQSDLIFFSSLLLVVVVVVGTAMMLVDSRRAALEYLFLNRK